MKGYKFKSLNKAEINKEIHLKYQIIWETQFNTNYRV